jgi:hypothetical protein
MPALEKDVLFCESIGNSRKKSFLKGLFIAFSKVFGQGFPLKLE